MTFEEFLTTYQKKEVTEYPNTVLTCVENPVVSVWIVTYNQKKYIQETIDSVLAQKTNFDVEIILGDDNSNDGTREICIGYAQRYPEKIRLFLHSRENAIQIPGDRPNPNFQGAYNWHFCRGKYIATLEGDDYWIDPLKLQKQVDFLEKNPTYSGVGTNFSVCDDQGKVLKQAKYTDFEGHDFRLTYINKFHAITRTLNVMYRNYPDIRSDLTDLSHAPFLDRIIGFLMAAKGPIRILPDITAMFRDGSGFFTPLRDKIGKTQLEAQWQILAKHFHGTEWETLCIASLHVVKATLYKKMNAINKSKFLLKNVMQLNPEPYFDNDWFKICISSSPEEIPQSMLMGEKFLQKLRELSTNETIHSDLSIQELIAVLEESKNDFLILDYDTKGHDFRNLIANLSQSLFKYHYRLFDIESRAEGNERNGSKITRLIYVLEGSKMESKLLNWAIPETTELS